MNGEITEEFRLKIKNEDKLNEMIGELNSIDNQIKIISKEMNEALGINKSLWILLNSKKKMYQNKYNIVSKNYLTIINGINNINLVNNMENGKQIAKFISDQTSQINIDTFNDNINEIKDAETETTETGDKLNNLFVNNFDGNIDDSEYQKALEQKILLDNETLKSTENNK